jgi:ABC-2 type transport system ATP-binding protein
MYGEQVQHTNSSGESGAPRPGLGLVRPDGRGPAGVHTRDLGKRFGDLWALRDLNLDVAPGTVLGLLGHNGAGKTTAIRILTTLSAPTTGSASVAGLDVAGDPAGVRRRIGVANQQATVDGLMTARANLVMVARLHHVPKRRAQHRADELLERFGLADAANSLVKTLSGGMRRRLDLAASLVAGPEVLFLDEPTTGLDPRSRGELWDMLRALVRDGTTLILTTQYLEEADKLADDIVVLDHGRTVAFGTPAELKSQIGDDRVDVTLRSPRDFDAVRNATSHLASNAASLDADALVATIPVQEGVRLVDVMRALDAAGIDPIDLDRREVSLDDVFLTLTAPGSRPEEATR